MGGYSIVIPENYVHRVKVSRVKGSQDVRLGLAETERSSAPAGAFAQDPCWEQGFFYLKPEEALLHFHYELV